MMSMDVRTPTEMLSCFAFCFFRYSLADWIRWQDRVRNRIAFKLVPFILTLEYSFIAIHLNFLIIANNTQFLLKIRQLNFPQTSIYALCFFINWQIIYICILNILAYKYLSRKRSCISKASVFVFHLLQQQSGII